MTKTADILRSSPAYFIDLEASSLFKGSWPIEIGISRVLDGVITSDARLIRPHETWSMDAWAPEAQEVHGINRGQLEAYGEDPLDVIEWFRENNIGVAVSDAPEFDARWLDKLLLLTDATPQVRMVDFDTYVMSTLPDTDAANAVFDFMEETEAPHRAGPDAHRMAEAWLKGSQYSCASRGNT